MDGDIAMAEAAGSQGILPSGGYRVPFPFNKSGEYVGYKTDHDPLQRGIFRRAADIQIHDRMFGTPGRGTGNPISLTAIRQYACLQRRRTEKRGRQASLPLNKQRLLRPDERYAVFSAVNIIWATGGEAGMYQASVYPCQPDRRNGVLLEAGLLQRI